MEKDRSSKVVAVAALLVAVVGLSVGFASFSRTLNIESSAEVSPVNNFNVVFSSEDDEVLTGPIAPTLTPDTEDASVISASNAIIDNDGNPTISDLAVNFSEPGQKAEYNFYVHPSVFDAYLRSVTFNSVAGDTKTKVCTAKDTEDTTASTVEAACESISLKVELTDSNNTVTPFTATNDAVKGHKVTKDTYAPVKVTIEYAANGAVADGDFTVKFGSVVLGYSTVDKK